MGRLSTSGSRSTKQLKLKMGCSASTGANIPVTRHSMSRKLHSGSDHRILFDHLGGDDCRVSSLRESPETNYTEDDRVVSSFLSDNGPRTFRPSSLDLPETVERETVYDHTSSGEFSSAKDQSMLSYLGMYA